MHNLFFGIPKHTTSIWKDHSILKADDFKVIQEAIDFLIPPPKIGCIPRKVGSLAGFSKLNGKLDCPVFHLCA